MCECSQIVVSLKIMYIYIWDTFCCMVLNKVDFALKIVMNPNCKDITQEKLENVCFCHLGSTPFCIASHAGNELVVSQTQA